MKKALPILFIVLALPILSNAQKNNFPHPFEFEKIDTANGTKEELYVKCRAWVAKSFNSAKSVIEMDDKEAGKIIGKGVFKYTFPTFMSYTDAIINYTFEIDIKNNRYRILLNSFNADYVHYASHILTGSYGSLEQEKVYFSKKKWIEIKKYAYKKSNDLISSLSDYVHSPSQSNDNW